MKHFNDAETQLKINSAEITEYPNKVLLNLLQDAILAIPVHENARINIEKVLPQIRKILGNDINVGTKDISKPELEPCPFCGGDAYISDNTWDGFFYCKCARRSCGASQEATHLNREKAIDAWNTRATSKRITELLNANNELVERARRAERINREMLECLNEFLDGCDDGILFDIYSCGEPFRSSNLKDLMEKTRAAIKSAEGE